MLGIVKCVPGIGRHIRGKGGWLEFTIDIICTLFALHLIVGSFNQEVCFLEHISVVKFELHCCSDSPAEIGHGLHNDQ